MDQRKIEEVKRKVKNGYPIGEIKSELRAQGFSEEEINACFSAYTYNMSVWYLLFGGIFLLAGIMFIGSNGSFLMVWSKATIGFILLLAAAALFIFYYKERLKKDEKSDDFPKRNKEQEIRNKK